MSVRGKGGGKLVVCAEKIPFKLIFDVLRCGDLKCTFFLESQHINLILLINQAVHSNRDLGS